MSLGGKTTETQSIDPDLKAASLAQLAMARNVGQLGFVPYKGATVAGLQPAQIAAMENTNAGLSAFGLNPSAIPTAGNLGPYEMYQQQLAQMAPGQRAFIDAMFIDPMTGMMAGAAPGASAMPPAALAAAQGGGAGMGGGGGMGGGAGGAGGAGMPRTGGGVGAFGLPDPMSGGFSGTNLPGIAGGLVNRVTRAVAPRGQAPAVRSTGTATRSAKQPSKSSKDSGARR